MDCPGGRPPADLSSLSPARFGAGRPGAALSDDALAERGAWQYAHYYDPLTA